MSNLPPSGQAKMPAMTGQPNPSLPDPFDAAHCLKTLLDTLDRYHLLPPLLNQMPEKERNEMYKWWVEGNVKRLVEEGK